MAVNTDKMRKDRDAKKSEQGIGNWFKPKKPGEYLLYICPPPEGVDLPYTECHDHWGLGPEAKKKVACLDLNRNEILTDERVIALLESPDVIDGGCPVCESLEDASDKDRRDRGARRSFLFNVVLFGYRKEVGRGEWEEPEEMSVETYSASRTVWEAITDIFFQEGDVTDPSKAVLLRLTRTGTTMKDTRYKVSAETASLREPRNLPKALKREVLEAVEPGGKADVFKLIAASVLPRAKVEALMDGVDLEEEKEGEEKAAADKPPKCFKLDYVNDSECKKCAFRGPCSKHLGIDLYPGHELKEGDRGYEASGKKRTARDEDDEPRSTRRKPTDDEPEERNTRRKKDEDPPARRRAADDDEPPARTRKTREPEEEEEEERPRTRTKKDEEPPPRRRREEPEEPEEDPDAELKKAGFDDRQILRISDDGRAFVKKHKLKGDWVSVLKSGEVQVIQDKLPAGHALKKDEEPEEEESEERPARKKDEPAARTTTRKPPPPEEDDEPAEPDDEPAVGASDGLDLDALERELGAAAKKKTTKK